MLTEIQIRSAKPGRYSDGRGDGLMLFVSPAGARKWVQRVKVGVRYRDIGHGSYPDVSLAEARRRAAEAKLQIAAGVDPLEARRAAKASDEAALGRTLRDAAEGYIAAHGAGWRSGKTAMLFRRSLEQHAADLLARDPAGIGLDDVRGVLAPIWTTKPVLAQKVRSRIEHALEWATAAGWRAQGQNPAAWRGALRTLLAKPAKVTRNRHHPALAWSRMPAYLAALRDETGNAARCLELVILAACRSVEARGADWSEVDLDGATWTIPAARMKAGKVHRVPLSAPALALLCSMLSEGGRKPAAGLIFPNLRTGEEFSDAALLALMRRMDEGSTKAGGEGWRDEHGERATPHGMRSAFRDWCGETGQPRELAEAALAHAMGGAVERAYARSDLFARRRALMEAWATACAPASRPATGNVVPLARASV